MSAKLTRLTHKIAILMFQVQRVVSFAVFASGASPETFGYTLVCDSGCIVLPLRSV